MPKTETAAEIALAASMAEHVPEIAASYQRLVRGQAERMMEALGPKLRGVTGNWTWARIYCNTVSQFLDTAKDGTRTLNDERLGREAVFYAELAVKEWQDKIANKLGDLAEIDVRSYATSGRFIITGKRGGQSVRMEQDRIINVSSKGLLFHQFPSRIYVDGKFRSAAAYARGA